MCDCINRVNKDLAAYNAAVTVNLIGPARAFVETYKVDEKKRGKPPMLQASFCPFCGEKYEKAERKSEAA